MNSLHSRLKIALLFFGIASLLLSACDLFTLAAPSTSIPPTQAPPTNLPGSDWLQIYFTDPTAPSARNYEGGPDVPLVKALDAAKLSIDVAAYNFNLWSIRDALVHAEQRGVKVRMVMETDNMEASEVQDLTDAGIPIVGDLREGLMHNKFMVIDRQQVWTGSMNFTVGGTYKDNNNLICLHDSQVVQDYTNEFEEMFLENRFGNDGKANTPFPKVTIQGTDVEVYFSPDDGVAARVVELLQEAQESIHFLAYSFTSNDISAAMLERSQAGVDVNGVMDAGQSSGAGSEFDPLKQAGLDVRLDGNTHGLMHNKVIIIDQKIVITGSYNFTAAAEDTNDENLLIIFNRDVAARYLEEFQKLFDQAQAP